MAHGTFRWEETQPLSGGRAAGELRQGLAMSPQFRCAHQPCAPRGMITSTAVHLIPRILVFNKKTQEHNMIL